MYNIKLDKQVKKTHVFGSQASEMQGALDIKNPKKSLRLSSASNLPSSHMDKKMEVINAEFIKINQRLDKIESFCSEENLKNIITSIISNSIEPVKEACNTVLSNFNQIRADIIKSSENEIIDLVFSILRKIVYGDIKDEQSIIKLIHKALEYCSDSGKINIHLAPKQAELINSKKDSLDIFKGKEELINVIPDSKILEGGCMIETSSGNIDAKLESQLQEIEKEFKKDD